MATLGNVGTGSTTAQFVLHFMVGNRFTAAQSGTVTDLVFRIKGASLALNNQPIRPIIYLANNATPDLGWTLVAVGTEQVIVGQAAVTNYTFTGLSASITSGQTYLLGGWSGPLTTGTAYCEPAYNTSGGTDGYYTAMTYSQLSNPTSPWPTGGTHGTEDKQYAANYIDFTPAATGGGVVFSPRRTLFI